MRYIQSWQCMETVICRGTYWLHARCPDLFSLNYITQSPWWPHTQFWLSKPITAKFPGLCKWQPPWPPFSSALVTGWYQCHWCHHACTWHHSIKGWVHPALCSLFGWMWLRSHLDLKLDTSHRHLPDCQFTHHSLVNLSIHWWPTSDDLLAGHSLVTWCGY